MFFQTLEPRRLLAVAAFLEDGRLIIRGSDGDDTVILFRGDDPTTIWFRGFTAGEGERARLVTFSNVHRGIFIDTGAGNDRIKLQGVRVFGSIRIDAGAGDDELIVRSTRPTGGLSWRGGDGNDSILIRKSTIQGPLVLDGGPGRDRTYLSFVHARQRVSIADTLGPSIIHFTRLSVDADARIATGASLDRLTIHDSTFKRNATITTSHGDDRIRIRGTIFRRTPIIDAGTGGNHIDREVILEWDFNNGAQGWEAGFADYDAGQIVTTKPDGTPVFAEEFFNLESGVVPLPDEMGVSDLGFKLSGINWSDDLFMYLSKELSSHDGIVAGADYRIRFTIKYANDFPAESLLHYLKAGGTSHAPQLVRDHEDTWPPFTFRINADIGIQGNSGANASVVGFLHNDRDLPRQFWASTRRTHTHSDSIAADATGRLWVLVGVDSAYESRVSVFFQTITVRLTPVTVPTRSLEGGPGD